MEKIGEIEGIKLGGASLETLLSEGFLLALKDSKLDVKVVSLVLVKEEGPENHKILVPFVINHQSSQEIKDKILHVSGSNEANLQTLAKIIKEHAK